LYTNRVPRLSIGTPYMVIPGMYAANTNWTTKNAAYAHHVVADGTPFTNKRFQNAPTWCCRDDNDHGTTICPLYNSLQYQK
jgi:hypothetical protein